MSSCFHYLQKPPIWCFTKHHWKDYELGNTHIPNYKLGANYCRKNLKHGGVCIYVHESLKFTNTNLLKHSKEQDIEIAVIQLKIHTEKVNIICIYRAPCGNFESFLNKLEIILNTFHKHKLYLTLSINSEFIPLLIPTWYTIFT